MDVSQKKLPKPASYAKCIFFVENRRKPDLQHFKHFVDEVSLPTVDILCLQEVKKLTGRAKATALFGWDLPVTNLPAARFRPTRPGQDLSAHRWRSAGR